VEPGVVLTVLRNVSPTPLLVMWTRGEWDSVIASVSRDVAARMAVEPLPTARLADVLD
jgi:hypothetical protein